MSEHEVRWGVGGLACINDTTMMGFVDPREAIERHHKDSWGEEYHVAGGQFTLRMREELRKHEHLSAAEGESHIRFLLKSIQLAKNKLKAEHKRLNFITQKVQLYCDHQWSEWDRGYGDDASWTRSCSVCGKQEETYERPDLYGS